MNRSAYWLAAQFFPRKERSMARKGTGWVRIWTAKNGEWSIEAQKGRNNQYQNFRLNSHVKSQREWRLYSILSGPHSVRIAFKKV